MGRLLSCVIPCQASESQLEGLHDDTGRCSGSPLHLAGKPRRKQDLRMATSIRVASGKRERAQPRRQEKPAGLPGQSPPAPHMVPSLYVSARSAQSHAERSHCPTRRNKMKHNSVLQRASIPSLSQMCNAGTCLHPPHVTGEHEAGERLP